MTTIADIKHRNRTNGYYLPTHWVNDWLLHVLSQPINFLITNSDYTLTHSELTTFTKGITTMQYGVPYAYLVGYANFYGERFLVDNSTLIPRADSELLVQLAINVINHATKSSVSVLELGTGSGCIGISIAKNAPTAKVLAVDICPKALAIAQKNAKQLLVDSCTFIQSNWYTALGDATVDIIIANPPYIAKDDPHLSNLTCEPMTALVADDNGLSDIHTISKGAVSRLNVGGLLMIEHGYNQAHQVQAIFKTYGLTDIVTHKDYGGNDRVTLGVFLDD